MCYSKINLDNNFDFNFDSTFTLDSATHYLKKKVEGVANNDRKILL
jgi:hypothetical protein